VSSDEYNFSIVPPVSLISPPLLSTLYASIIQSRPTSKTYTTETEGIVSTGMLSAEDANHRPLPSLAEEPPTVQNPVISQLPPGFVPYGGGTSTGCACYFLSWNLDLIYHSPAGVPLPPSTIGSMTPGHSFHSIPGGRIIEEPDTEPVIPVLTSRSRKASSARSAKSGSTSTRDRRRRPPSPDSDDVSSNLSEGSLTTPPARGKTPLPLYAPSNASAAGVPLRPPSAASSAARVPLPPSTTAGTPKSTRSRATSLRSVYNNAGRTPASHNRTFTGELSR
jgi:hypothetical protein